MSQEFKSSETHESSTSSETVTTNTSPSSEFNINQLRVDEDACPSSDSSLTATFYSTDRDGIKKLDLDPERITNKIYISPSGEDSSHSLDGVLIEDSPWDKEIHVPPTPPASAEFSEPSSMSRLHTIAFVIVTCCAQFLSLCGMNQTVAPVMILAKYFDITDYGTLSWFSAAYSLTVGTFILPAGETILYQPYMSMLVVFQPPITFGASPVP